MGIHLRTTLRRLTAGVGLIAGLAAAASPAAAATSPWETSELAPGTVVEARLIAAVDGAGTLSEVPAGLHVRLPGDWKTYWRSPGDAGYPPALDFAASINLDGHDLAFPAPERFSVLGLDTFGYGEEVVFPLTLTPATPGEAMLVRGSVDLLVCDDICVPSQFFLSMVLPAGPADPDVEAAHLIDRFADQVPTSVAERAGIAVTAVAATPDGLRVALDSAAGFDAPDLFVEAPDRWAFAAPTVRRADGAGLIADLVATQRPAPDADLTGADVTLTVVDGVRALEHAAVVAPVGTLAAGVPVAAVETSATDWLRLLGIALLGGLILNLMPCVLPVLSVKLFSVLHHGGKAPAAIRAGFLATSAGIVASFWLLAGGLIAVQAAGATIGWGIQFQQPVFLAFMIVVLALFAFNLLGLFEIRLPGAIGDRAAQTGAGGKLSDQFLTGGLATLLATPCSAPFVGTAVAFALSRGPLEILAIFTALGIGLALPYLAVAAAPGMARALPRPGRWMVWVRTVMALALAGTAAWLLSIMAVQTSPTTVALVAGLATAIGLALWLRRRAPGQLRPVGSLAVAALAVAALATPALRPDTPAAAGPGASTGADAVWSVFRPDAIAEQVAAGRVVFVDITADWCLTCHVNKALVLTEQTTVDRLGSETVTAMRGDWTRPDPQIADFLAEHNRYGIPFNAVWGPGAPEGIVLPELLTVDGVAAALDRAAGETDTASRL